MYWLAAVVVLVVGLGVALRRSGDTERALEQALALAFAGGASPWPAVRPPAAGTGDPLDLPAGAAGPAADRAFLARHHLARPWGRGGGVVLVRTYAVPGDLAVEEGSALLGAPVAPGSTLVARAANPHLAELLVTLARPGFLDRAAAATGVSVGRIRGALRARGIDLDRRTLDGVPWTRLGRGKHSYHVVTVGVADGPYTRFSLEDARLLDPAAKPGDRWDFPTLEERLPRFFEGLVADRGTPFRVIGGGVLDVETIETRRAVLAPTPLPAALRGHVDGPVRPLYAGGAHGVLVFDVPEDRAEATWRALDAVAPATGYRPVLLGHAQAAAQEAPLGWRHAAEMADFAGGDGGLPGGRYAGSDPAGILARVDEVDLAELIGPRGTYGDLDEQHGPWPDDPRPSAGLVTLARPVGEPVTVALVPTDAAWKVAAWLPWLLASGEATPSPAAVCAVSRRWEERWGARVVLVAPATVEWALTRPPATRDDALALATEHFHLAPEADDRPTIEGRAADLVGAGFLYGWWD